MADVQGTATDHSDIAALDLVDQKTVDWPRVERTAYLIHQRMRYEYEGPIANLQHTLMVVPPPQHGDQRLILGRVDIEPAENVNRSDSTDQFGNSIITLSAPHLSTAFGFEAWLVLERRLPEGPHRIRLELAGDSRWIQSTPLTEPDAALHDAARSLGADGGGALAVAERINAWVHEHLTYKDGVTDVRTGAADALHIGRGVCQDYAHIMIALCRLCDIPARYVSGHLLGEGGTHAWVEVIVVDPANPTSALVHPFDPTHGRRAGLNYLTVAVGRDYRDVAPTSGTYASAHAGELVARKRVGLVNVEYAG